MKKRTIGIECHGRKFGGETRNFGIHRCGIHGEFRDGTVVTPLRIALEAPASGNGWDNSKVMEFRGVEELEEDAIEWRATRNKGHGIHRV